MTFCRASRKNRSSPMTGRSYLLFFCFCFLMYNTHRFRVVKIRRRTLGWVKSDAPCTGVNCN